MLNCRFPAARKLADDASEWFMNKAGGKYLLPSAGADFASKQQVSSYIDGKTTRISKFANATHAWNKVWKSADKAVQLDGIHRYETGQRQAIPGWQPIADYVARVEKELDDIRHLVWDNPASIENHVKHQWKVLPNETSAKTPEQRAALARFRAATSTRKPLSGNTGFNKQRTFKTIQDGIAAGGVPISTSLIDLAHYDAAHVLQAQAAHNLLENIKASSTSADMATGKNRGELILSHSLRNNPEMVTGKNGKALARVNDPMFQVYRPTSATNKTPVHIGSWYVEPPLANMINAHTATDMVKGAFGGMIDIKNALTQFELIGPTFHVVNEVKEAIDSALGMGLTKGVNNAVAKLTGQNYDVGSGLPHVLKAYGQPAHGLSSEHGLARSMLGMDDTTPVGYANSEGELLRKYNAHFFEDDASNWLRTDPEGQKLASLYPNIQELSDLLHGANFKEHIPEEYKIGAGNSMQEALADADTLLKKIGATQAGIRPLAAGMKAITKALFEEYIPRLKAAQAYRNLNFELQHQAVRLGEKPDSNGVFHKPDITREQIAHRVVSAIDAKFGEVNWERLRLNRNVTTALQLAFRAPGWAGGNLAAPGMALKFQLEDTLAHINAGRYKEAALLHPEMGWVLANAIHTAILGTLIQHAMTGLLPGMRKAGDKAFGDARQTAQDMLFPRIDANDPSQRMSLPGVWKDLLEAGIEPKQFVNNKVATVFHSVPEALSNTDYKNVRITDHPDTPAGIAALIGHVVNPPFSATGAVQSWQNGDSPAKVGLHIAFSGSPPHALTSTPLQSFLYDHRNSGPPEKRSTYDAAQLAHKEEQEKTGLMPADLAIIHQVKRASSDDIPDIWRIANEHERELIAPVVNTKINSRVFINQVHTDDELEKRMKAAGLL